MVYPNVKQLFRSNDFSTSVLCHEQQQQVLENIRFLSATETFTATAIYKSITYGKDAETGPHGGKGGGGGQYD